MIVLWCSFFYLERAFIFVDSCFLCISIIFIRVTFFRCIFITLFLLSTFFYFHCFWFAWSDLIGSFSFFGVLFLFHSFLITFLLRTLFVGLDRMRSPNIRFIHCKTSNTRFTKLSKLHGFFVQVDCYKTTFTLSYIFMVYILIYINI